MNFEFASQNITYVISGLIRVSNLYVLNIRATWLVTEDFNKLTLYTETSLVHFNFIVRLKDCKHYQKQGLTLGFNINLPMSGKWHKNNVAKTLPYIWSYQAVRFYTSQQCNDFWEAGGKSLHLILVQLHWQMSMSYVFYWTGWPFPVLLTNA